MIQANELRIGNYIYNPVQRINFKVDTITIQNVINDNRNYTTKRKEMYYQPIPLTEEILLKCGFDRYEYMFSIEYYINGFKLRYIKKDKKYVYQIETRNIEKRHLHQLQNIYFDLEEKELEVNL